MGVPTIDDESLVDLSLNGDVPRPLASFAAQAPIYSVGSLSKLFWGGLRVGWVRCPVDAVGPILRLKSVSDLSTSLVSQAIALRLLEQRVAVASARREQLSHKLALWSDLLRTHLPSWTFEPPIGGLSLWVDTGIDASAFAQIALRDGVALVTSAETTVDLTAATYVRLPLALENRVIEEGVRRLARAYGHITAEDGRGEPSARLLV